MGNKIITNARKPKKQKIVIFNPHDFNIHHTIGTGAISRVRLVQNKQDKSISVMKILNKDQVIQTNQGELIKNEILIHSQLNNSFITKFLGFSQTKGHLYINIELCSGGELFHLLRKKGRFDIDETVFYIAQVLVALKYLREKGVVFRDLKPENILIDKNGYIKLTDFGCSKRIYRDRTYSVCGTTRYMAPEVIENSLISEGLCYNNGVIVDESEHVTNEINFNNNIIIDDEVDVNRMSSDLSGDIKKKEESNISQIDIINNDDPRIDYNLNNNTDKAFSGVKEKIIYTEIEKSNSPISNSNIINNSTSNLKQKVSEFKYDQQVIQDYSTTGYNSCSSKTNVNPNKFKDNTNETNRIKDYETNKKKINKDKLKSYSYSVDYWALGVLTYELISGIDPFASKNEYVVKEKILKNKLYFNDNFNDVSISFIKSLLNNDPEKRLGAANIDEIKKHSFFEGIDFNLLEQKKLRDVYNVPDKYVEITSVNRYNEIEPVPTIYEEDNDPFLVWFEEFKNYEKTKTNTNNYNTNNTNIK